MLNGMMNRPTRIRGADLKAPSGVGDRQDMDAGH